MSPYIELAAERAKLPISVEASATPTIFYIWHTSGGHHYRVIDTIFGAAEATRAYTALRDTMLALRGTLLDRVA